MNNFLRVLRCTAASVCFALAACGGGGDDGDAGGGAPGAGTVVGATGGTVGGPNGASVLIPAGALATDTTIRIEQTAAGAPELPTGLVAQGPMFAFTPHGTTFTVPVTMTMPFDPALVPAGLTPQFYKTNAQGQWEQVANATFGTSTVTAEITGFSSAQVVVPPLQRNDPVREWRFDYYPGSGGGGGLTRMPAPNQGGQQTGGVIGDIVEFGGGFGGADLDTGVETSLFQGQARGFVTASPDGVIYGVYAEAPDGGVLDAIGGRATFKQTQSFIKRAADAKLTFTVTRAQIEIRDYQPPPNPERPGLRITGEVLLSVGAYKQTAQDYFFYTAGTARLSGAFDTFVPFAQDESFSRKHLWSIGDFDVVTRPSFYQPFGDDKETSFGCPGTFASLKLKKPLTVSVDLSSVAVGEEFTLRTDTYADTNNRRLGSDDDCLGTSAIAYLRDPSGVSGTTITMSGLEPTNRPLPSPPVEVLLPPAACVPGPGPNADAGVLQFSAADYSVVETAGAPSSITVTRTGGSRGAVTATFSTSDGTGAPTVTSTPAVAGVDYTAVNATVFFGDGDTAPRSLRVPTIQNLVRAPAKTLILTLSQPGGCAALGALNTAVLTILDDGGADLPPAPSGLDTGFGTAGKATLERFGGDRSAMALQGDGKIVMAGGTFTDFILARFNANGSVDASFGSGGKVSTDMVAGEQEEALGVAVQADGKIVVVGYTGVATTPPQAPQPANFALARYNADGSLDTSFGVGGKVVTGVVGRAYAVAIQPDGRMVVAGEATGAADLDFVLARYNSNGSLDTGFGSGGRVVTDVGNTDNQARNLVLQPNGAIVVSGGVPKRISSSPTPDGHTDVVRYSANGSPDTSFGAGGKLALPGALVGEGLARQNDGKLVLVGSVIIGSGATQSTDFALMRLNADGSPDTGFGNGGLVTTPISNERDGALAVALQADGRIVVAGHTSNINANFALARYNANGTLDASFGNGFGILTIDFSGSDDLGESVLVQPDGKIVVGGQARNNGDGYGVARINP